MPAQFSLALLAVLFGCLALCLAKPQVDYIVVGGGGGGAVIANRLSADPSNSVLLIDLGPESCPACDAALGANSDSSYPWLLNAIPRAQPYTLLVRKPSFFQYQGLGGNTKRFGGVHVRPSKQFLDANFPVGFKYADLLPHFLATDDHFCHYLPYNVSNITAADCIAYHGKGGEMEVVPQVVSQLNAPIRDLVAYLGTTDVGNTTDYNNPNTKRGIGYEQRWGHMSNRSDVNSTRSRKDVQQAFLPVALRAARPNLEVLPFTRVTRLLFGNGNKRKNVIGVEYVTNGTEVDTVRARKHVFVCAGVLETPKLLELSGIGSPAILGALGIPLVANNTAVGASLHAHHALIMSYRTKTGIFHDASKSSYNAAQIFLNISSPPGGRPADFQVEMLNGFYVENVEGDANGLPAELVGKFLTGQTNGFPVMAAEIEHNDVSTVGFAHAKSQNPAIPADFDLGWGFGLFATQDIPRFLKAMAKIRDIFTGNNTFSNKHIVEEIWPGERYRDYYRKQGITAEPLLTTLSDTLALQSAMTHFFHLTSTCSLGSCTNLDAEVNGVTGVSVCDNSLLPANPDANPTTTLVAVCDKIAKRRLVKDA